MDVSLRIDQQARPRKSDLYLGIYLKGEILFVPPVFRGPIDEIPIGNAFQLVSDLMLKPEPFAKVVHWSPSLVDLAGVYLAWHLQGQNSYFKGLLVPRHLQRRAIL